MAWTPDKANVPLSAKVLNVLLMKARDITHDPSMAIADHEWLEDALPADVRVIQNLTMYQEAIALSFRSAISQALLGGPQLEARLPETVGQLKQRLEESIAYAETSLQRIEGLTPPAVDYAKQMYSALQESLYEEAEALQSKPRARSVPHSR